MEVQTEVFSAGDLEALRTELKGSNDFLKLCAGIEKLGDMASSSEPINIQAFGYLLTFLTNRYPKIRKMSGDQIYVVLLLNGTLVPGDKRKKAIEIISGTCWGGDIEEAKGKKLELCAMCNLNVGTFLKANDGTPGKAVEQTPTSDENASDSSLVGSAGF